MIIRPAGPFSRLTSGLTGPSLTLPNSAIPPTNDQDQRKHITTESAQQLQQLQTQINDNNNLLASSTESDTDNVKLSELPADKVQLTVKPHDTVQAVDTTAGVVAVDGQVRNEARGDIKDVDSGKDGAVAATETETVRSVKQEKGGEVEAKDQGSRLNEVEDKEQHQQQQHEKEQSRDVKVAELHKTSTTEMPHKSTEEKEANVKEAEETVKREGPEEKVVEQLKVKVKVEEVEAAPAVGRLQQQVEPEMTSRPVKDLRHQDKGGSAEPEDEQKIMAERTGKTVDSPEDWKLKQTGNENTTDINILKSERDRLDVDIPVTEGGKKLDGEDNDVRKEGSDNGGALLKSLLDGLNTEGHETNEKNKVDNTDEKSSQKLEELMGKTSQHKGAEETKNGQEGNNAEEEGKERNDATSSRQIVDVGYSYVSGLIEKLKQFKSRYIDEFIRLRRYANSSDVDKRRSLGNDL